MMAARPLRRNPAVFQKTLSVNDFYLEGPAGRIRWATCRSSARCRVRCSNPPDNRITVTSEGRIRVHWKPNNLATHRKLAEAATAMMKRAGYPLVFTEPMGIETNSHQCGTLRFGDDPATSVLNPFCRTHDIDNLYVMDSSFLPSSAAMNPVLTIAAQALRVAEHIVAEA